MSETEARQERRGSARISPKGTVIVLAGEDARRCRIANISNSGVLLTTLITPTEVLLERPVDLEVRLDGKDMQWLRLAGKIVRIKGDTIAIGFGTVPTAFTHLIDSTTTSSYGDDRRLTVILVDATVDRRGPFAEAFRGAGCSVAEVSTPLEAIHKLGELEFEPALIVIADSIPSSGSDELRTFVEREHKRAKLVTIGDTVSEPEGLEHWLSSANPGDDLITRVRQILLRSTSPR